MRAYSEPISITAFNQGKANKVFEEVKKEGIKAVLKNNKRIGMLVSPKKYDEMTKMLEDYELLLTAMQRMNTSSGKTYSMKEVMTEFGITQEDLDNVEVDLDI